LVSQKWQAIISSRRLFQKASIAQFFAPQWLGDFEAFCAHRRAWLKVRDCAVLCVPFLTTKIDQLQLYRCSYQTFVVIHRWRAELIVV
jgi:hypothetical protein